MAKPAKINLTNFTNSIKIAALELEANSSQSPLNLLKDQNLTSPLIITCSQALRVKRLVAWLKDKIFEKTDAEFNSYFGSEITKKQDVDNLKAEFLNQSLFSKTKLLVIYDADKVKAAFAKPLADTIKNGTGDAFVILAGAKINTQTPLLNYLKDTASQLEIKDLNPTELTRWISQEAKTAGASGIEPGAIKLLADSYGNELTALSNEIAKLALLVPVSEAISEKLTRELLTKNPEQTSFELFTQLGKKNLAASTKLAKDLLAQGLHPLQLSAFLTRCYRTLIANFDGEKSNSSELANGWFVGKVSPVKRFFTLEELGRSLEVLKEMDKKLKSTSTDEELLFTICVERLVSR